MKFVIRDDDCCGFTRPDQIETSYRGILDVIPINLSITPFRVAGYDPNVPRDLYGSSAVLPLLDNSDLVSFLRQHLSNGRLDIALHGYHHAPNNGGPEYLAGTDLTEKTASGKRYLQEVLCTDVATFVPPNNTIGQHGLRAIVLSGLNLVGVAAFRHKSLSVQAAALHATRKFWRIVHGFDYPFSLDFGDHKEISYYSLTPLSRLDYLLSAIDQVFRSNGVFVLATHYHAFNKRIATGETIGDAIRRLIDCAQSYQHTKFCSYRDLWNG